MAPVFVLKPKDNPSSYVNYVILDWSNVVHRAVAVAGTDKFLELLTTMLVNYRRRFHQWKFCFALDSPGGVEARKAVLPSYKQNRASRDDGEREAYKTSLDLSLELIQHLDGLVVLARQGEADDVIASFIRQSKRGRKFVIITEDRDLWQLIGPNVTVWTRQNNEINQESCIRSLGTLPNRVPLIKALLGDPSDCIPRGVERVKKEILLKVARTLRTPDGLEHVLQTSDWINQQDQQRLRDGWPVVLRNYSLIKLKCDLSLNIKPLHPSTNEMTRFLSAHHLGITRQDLDLLVAKR
jgi:5'-3' exonuclease